MQRRVGEIRIWKNSRGVRQIGRWQKIPDVILKKEGQRTSEGTCVMIHDDVINPDLSGATRDRYYDMQGGYLRR